MNTPTRHPRRRRSGFFVLDAVVALSITVLLIALIAAALGRSHHSARALADRRAATRLAERVLIEGAAGMDAAQVQIAELPRATDGRRWLAVTVRYRQAEATLIGPAPQEARP